MADSVVWGCVGGGIDAAPSCGSAWFPGCGGVAARQRRRRHAGRDRAAGRLVWVRDAVEWTSRLGTGRGGLSARGDVQGAASAALVRAVRSGDGDGLMRRRRGRDLTPAEIERNHALSLIR